MRDPTFLCARLAIWASSHPRPINSPTLRNRHPPYPPPLHRRRRRSARLPTLYPPLRHLAVSLSTLIPSSLYLSAIRHVAQDISTNPPRRPPQRLRLPLFITTSQVHGQRVDTHSIPSIRTCSRERSQGAFRSTIPLQFGTDHGPFHQLKKALSKNSANLPSSQSIHYGAIVSIIFSNVIHIMHRLTPALPPQPSTPSNSSQPLMMRKPVRPSHPYRAANFADSSVRLEQNSGPSGLLNALALRFILDVHPLILRWSIWAWDFAVHLRFFSSLSVHSMILSFDR